MEDRNCELLFNYLKSILYDKKIQTLDPDVLDPQFKKLGLGLNYLESAITEMKQNSAALSKGDLSSFHPSRENLLCDNLKNIHANLEHLTWQAIQVSKGDYSQHVSYLGEFSEAFNTMTSQLAEREKELKREAEFEREHSMMIEKYNRLLLEMIGRSNDDMIVTDSETGHVLYSSRNSIGRKLIEKFIDTFQHDIYRVNEEEWKWQYSLADGKVYHIVSVLTEWEGRSAYAHYVHDFTEEKEYEEQLRNAAEIDPLTKIANRYAFKKYMKGFLNAEDGFTLCYCDLDHLKRVNDTYGHNAGDEYLCAFVDVIQKDVRNTDFFARIGGDEFCIILKNCSKEKAILKLQAMRENFSLFQKYGESSFSYGVIEISEHHRALVLDELLSVADKEMYTYKKKHHEER